MLVESDIQAQAERVKQASLAADDFLNLPPGDDGELLLLLPEIASTKCPTL